MAKKTSYRVRRIIFALFGVTVFVLYLIINPNSYEFASILNGEVEKPEEISEKDEDNGGQRRDCGADRYFETERLTKSFRVSRAVKLRAENTGAGNGSENAKVEYEDQHARDGYGGGLGVAEPSYHKVVEHIHKVCDAVLYEDGQHKHEYPS